MYGMIHRALHDFVLKNSSTDEWSRIKEQLAISPESMISTVVYPDSETFELAQRCADILGIPLEQLLRRFGHFWVTFSETGSYRHIVEFTGKDLPSFIENLDRMHQAVVSVMPQADVPSFQLSHCQSGELVVDYHSNRQGLEPFVIGLLEGLVTRFGHKGSVEQLQTTANPARFIIRYID